MKLRIELSSSNFKNQTFVLFMLGAIIGAIIALLITYVLFAYQFNMYVKLTLNLYKYVYFFRNN
jgi:hypothetical protein